MQRSSSACALKFAYQTAQFIIFYMRPRHYATLLTLLISIPVVLTLGLLGWACYPIALPRTEVEVRIKPGSDAIKIAHQLQQNGIDIHPRLFYFLVKLVQYRLPSQPKSGTYAIQSGLTPYQIYMKMVRGDVVYVDITIIEGWSFQQMRAAINAQPRLTHVSFDMTPAQLLNAIGAQAHDFCGNEKPCTPHFSFASCLKNTNAVSCNQAIEGLFSPDTYRFTPGTSDLDLYKQAYHAQKKRLHSAWLSRDNNLPYRNPYEALIMASIIEKETGFAPDRHLIAAVFINRLKKNMRLQTDPSVIYGLGEKFNGNLRKQDLLADTPYNTYTRTGLPPTPISLPSKTSIMAALHPAAVDLLYFVGRGDGSSVFSRDLLEHNRAVNQFQRKPQR